MENKNYQTKNGFSGQKNNFQNDLLLFNIRSSKYYWRGYKDLAEKNLGTTFLLILKLKLCEKQPGTLFSLKLLTS